METLEQKPIEQRPQTPPEKQTIVEDSQASNEQVIK